MASSRFERRQVITKGAEIEVDIRGQRKLALVTNRPGQNGEIQAKVISDTIEVSPKKKKAGKEPAKKPAKTKEKEEKPPEKAK